MEKVTIDYNRLCLELEKQGKGCGNVADRKRS